MQLVAQRSRSNAVTSVSTVVAAFALYLNIAVVEAANILEQMRDLKLISEPKDRRQSNVDHSLENMKAKTQRVNLNQPSSNHILPPKNQIRNLAKHTLHGRPARRRRLR